jgi:SAM-dependent methyltransferase
VKPKSLLVRLLYRLRDLRSRELYRALREHSRGEVLDVGGWDFYAGAAEKGVAFLRWTTLESDPQRLPESSDPRVTITQGDGCAMEFADASFDTVLCVQVLEHVFDPIRMVAEVGRVLRPGGKAVLLIPCTSTMHLAPHYHGNFSRYWIREALGRAGLEIVELRELGGVWSTIASRAFFFFLQAVRYEGMSDPAIRRGALFWLLLPFQMLFALFLIPVALLLALGDLGEEPNNHLVVACKPRRPAR